MIVWLLSFGSESRKNIMVLEDIIHFMMVRKQSMRKKDIGDSRYLLRHRPK